MGRYSFLDNEGTFEIRQPENTNYLYFPLAGTAGLKSAVTPSLNGDAKLDQESFLYEPVSSENLHNNRSSRNFWVIVDGKEIWSAAGQSAEAECMKGTEEQEESKMEAGLLFMKLSRTSKKYQLSSEITMFVPVSENVELFRVKITNTAEHSRKIAMVTGLPIYGRSADNIRDHRNVTSMLHRISVTEHGVILTPTMSFDEKGHRRNHRSYFVAGSCGNGESPDGFYPTVDSFLGEGGSFTHPECVYKGLSAVQAGESFAGKEAVGGLRFSEREVAAGESAEYIILAGISDTQEEIEALQEKYRTVSAFEEELQKTKDFWKAKVNVRYETGNQDYDRLLRWISVQPFLRRIYGCSFLPHHDYGRGGRGWRDLWQDCLSLLLMNPGDVREMLVANIGGVRIDGTNATIIGAGDGNFIADRNGIARVWMDHAVWPFMTILLYIEESGDFGILEENAPYFKDAQTMRGMGTDTEWEEVQGNKQRTKQGEIYEGTLLEHLLIEHMMAFCEVGEHGILKLRGADWNDALDMAAEHGESVAFSCAYAGNMKDFAKLLRAYQERTGKIKVRLAKEITVLFGYGKEKNYADLKERASALRLYLESVYHSVSGDTEEVSVDLVASDLEEKAEFLMDHIRKQEWLKGSDTEGWFNSYYDNSRNRVEGNFDGKVRMMLTGQVFAIMSGTATDEQVQAITKAADHYLYRKEVGGYRLNTDFEELKFDMGRMFGFAYGEKENGAVFSHMTVMYANALYRRGFVHEGYKALYTLAETALNFETSKIFPGIPEYFNAEGRGLYHYLTGAASWYMLTVITEMFGVRGAYGSLAIQPKLLKEQFDEEGNAAIALLFGGKQFKICIKNPQKKEYGEYRIGKADCDGDVLESPAGNIVLLAKEQVEALDDREHLITVTLQ
ncbi:MAG: cellobiose phosphorylase [Lachnospiraceae bacterium]|nr:cellobiose phosphorylase [Lachnospiraceae bacterium]